MKLVIALLLSVGFCLPVAFSQEHMIMGHVVDRDGKAVANATVSSFWRANGNSTHQDGTPFDLSDRKQLREFWGRLGHMAPASSEDSQVTKEDGSFAISLNGRDRALFALDAERNLGCVIEVPSSSKIKGELELQLVPLVTVKAEFRSAVESKNVSWSHAYVELAPNKTKPLASDRLISCGSFDLRLEFRLPPGDYRLDAYAISDLESDTVDLRVHPAPKFTIRDIDTELDLGVLQLTLAPPGRENFETESKRQGRWQDYTQHYGEQAPRWHSVDGRAIDHKKNLEGLRGKWVLLDFWGMTCAPCLARGIPKMMEFYEKNSKSKSKFEIVGVCIDFSGEIDRMEKLNKAMSSIETNVWKGKTIPLPIVLDNTFTTWERYGIPGLGTVVLIDPEGRLVEGDETTLQAILDQAEQSNGHEGLGPPVLTCV